MIRANDDKREREREREQNPKLVIAALMQSLLGSTTPLGLPPPILRPSLASIISPIELPQSGRNKASNKLAAS